MSEPLVWRRGEVVALRQETPRVRTLLLALEDWPGHHAGQHVDVRLTAEDGYQAQRSYSIASAPGEAHLALTVERLDDGEVSPYLAEEMRVGDQLELRGPIGGYFAWRASLGGPLLLLAGGSGVVPLRAIVRHRAALGDPVPTRLLYSARSLEEVIYREEATGVAGPGLAVHLTLTRAAPAGWRGHRGRVDAALLAEVAFAPGEHPLVYICGPNGFVSAAADGLVALGHDPAAIRTERFGPSG